MRLVLNVCVTKHSPIFPALWLEGQLPMSAEKTPKKTHKKNTHRNTEKKRKIFMVCNILTRNGCDAQSGWCSVCVTAFVSTLIEETDAISLKQHPGKNWGTKHKQNRENCMVVLNVCIITHKCVSLHTTWMCVSYHTTQLCQHFGWRGRCPCRWNKTEKETKLKHSKTSWFVILSCTIQSPALSTLWLKGQLCQHCGLRVRCPQCGVESKDASSS